MEHHDHPIHGQTARATHVRGAKIALICEDSLIVYLRDEKPDIPNPGRWDFPGGVREANETALACVLRETVEEFGIHVPYEAICYASTCFASNPHREIAFFVGHISCELISQIVFGDEGQYWRMMSVEEFLGRSDTVSTLQQALLSYLERSP